MRSKARPEWVREVTGLGRYITIHPMANETELLAHLGMSASSCISVDLYWQYEDDVRFVEIVARGYPIQREVGVFVRKKRDGLVNIMAKLDAEAVTSKEVEAVLRVAVGGGIDVGNPGEDFVKL